MAGTGTRTVRNVSAGAVAAIASWSSYLHMVHVALRFGERPEVAYALPFSVDGMLVVASVVMVDDKRTDGRVRPVARLAFAAGVIASVAANIAGAHPSIGARIVAGWPALALLLVVEMLIRPPVPAATEALRETATHQPPAAEGSAPPRSPQVPVELLPPAADLHPSGTKATAPADEQPPSLTPQPQPGHATLTSTAPQTHAAALPVDRGAVRCPVIAAAHVAQPAGPKAPVDGGLPARADVPPIAVVPPPVVVPAEPAPPRRERPDVRASGGRDRRADPPRPTAAHRRRPAATTRQLARQILATEPHLSRAEVAARLGVSARRLREVLATA